MAVLVPQKNKSLMMVAYWDLRLQISPDCLRSICQGQWTWRYHCQPPRACLNPRERRSNWLLWKSNFRFHQPSFTAFWPKQIANLLLPSCSEVRVPVDQDEARFFLGIFSEKVCILARVELKLAKERPCKHRMVEKLLASISALPGLKRFRLRLKQRRVKELLPSPAHCIAEVCVVMIHRKVADWGAVQWGRSHIQRNFQNFKLRLVWNLLGKHVSSEG